MQNVFHRGIQRATMVWQLLQAFLALVCTTPSRPHTQNVGLLAGNGGWDKEDADHLRAK
jgi:hypothetical protein